MSRSLRRLASFIFIWCLTVVTSLPVRADDLDSVALDDGAASSHVWSFLLPAFVVHGLEPGGDAASYMPRKLMSDGRAVATPGVGFEYRSASSLDVMFAAVKDCYDDYAGSLQVGQSFDVASRIQLGYTAGLYIRQTPITCYSSTTTTTSSSGSGGAGGLLGRIGGRGGTPQTTTNSFTTTTCAFSDNLPLRLTTTFAGDYIDIIPTPFATFSAGIGPRSWHLELKILSNFYLNEFGLGIPF